MLDEERRGFEEGLTRKRRERIEGIRVAKKKKKKEGKKKGRIYRLGNVHEVEG